MIYSNPEFFLLLFPTLALFWLAKSQSVRFYCLLFASLAFYSWSGVRDTLIFLLVILSSWWAVKFGDLFPRFRRTFLTLGVSIMVAHLFFWKYAGWVIHEIQSEFPSFLGGRSLFFSLPVGISFFTLQGIAYLVDCGKNKAKLMKLKEYLLFKSFFPQLVAGPIVRSGQLLPQLKVLTGPEGNQVASGLSLFCLGFAKKLLIADRIGSAIDPVFQNPGRYDRGTLLLGILGYTCQIWADFSGYTDMGRGVARWFGIELPENFRSPYLARNPGEFWKRWHITLSEWIRDYLYIPMGGNRGSAWRVAFVTLVTMGIAGFWHGASWTFVVWGLFHGALILVHRLVRKRKSLTENAWPVVVFKWALMQGAVMLGWLLFRSATLESFWVYASKIISGTPGEAISLSSVIYPAAAAALVMQIVFYQDLKTGETPVMAKPLHLLGKIVRGRERLGGAILGTLGGAFLALIFAASLLFRTLLHAPPFIYFQF